MRVLCFGALGLLAATSASAQLFGVGDFAPFQTQSLYTIDLSTGAATLVGSTGLRDIADIAYDLPSSTMYALTVGADLYTINTSTGAATFVAARAGTTPEGSLAFLLQTGQLFTTASDVLGNVSTSTAAFTSLGGAASSSDTDISGLAFDVPGRLFGYAKNGSGEDSLVRFDTATGASTRVGLTGITASASVGGLAFERSTGRLFLTDGGALHTVDTLTGAATLVGQHGRTGFSGIAFIPAPGALALLGFGLLAARRR